MALPCPRLLEYLQKEFEPSYHVRFPEQKCGPHCKTEVMRTAVEDFHGTSPAGAAGIEGSVDISGVTVGKTSQDKYIEDGRIS